MFIPEIDPSSRRSIGKQEKKRHLLAASLMVLEDFIGLSGAETMNLITLIKFKGIIK